MDDAPDFGPLLRDLQRGTYHTSNGWVPLPAEYMVAGTAVVGSPGTVSTAWCRPSQPPPRGPTVGQRRLSRRGRSTLCPTTTLPASHFAEPWDPSSEQTGLLSSIMLAKNSVWPGGVREAATQPVDAALHLFVVVEVVRQLDDLYSADECY